MNTKKALVTGTTGQDASYLIELLLQKKYEVWGMVRIVHSDNFKNIKHLLNNPNFHIITGDLGQSDSIDTVIQSVKPDEVYNLGALTQVGLSFKHAEQYGNICGLGPLRILESLRRYKPDARFYQASTSELFGAAREMPQTELTPFYPRSPYGVAKLYAYWITVNYREAYNMFACNGILFNHESPRRGDNFVTKKIVRELVKVFKKEQEYVTLGNLEAKRDWGYAPDYVEGMWLMLQQHKPDDYILATGETHTVREFVEEVCLNLKLDEGRVVKIDPELIRPAEVDILKGDYSKAKSILGWEPRVKFKELVKIMVEEELK